MRSNRIILSYLSSIFMMLILAWLTVSAPFVNACLQQKPKLEKKMNISSLLAGAEEEKAPSSTSAGTINEYLHEDEELQHPSVAINTSYQAHQISACVFYHGELVSPPPEI